jgi:hypothetical protein
MHNPPADATARRAASPLVCYEVDQLPPSNLALYQQARESMSRATAKPSKCRPDLSFVSSASRARRSVI